MAENIADYANPEEFKKLVNARRSIRVYKDSPVPETVMRECLELALLAPNSSNLQPWEFYWVRTPEKKKEIARLCFNQPAATTAQEIVIAVARTKTWKPHAKQMVELLEKSGEKIPKPLFDYYKKLVPFVYSMGPLGVFGLVKKVIYAVTGLFRPIVREPTSKSGLQIWAIKSTALACQNLMMAFRAYGYDTCPMEGLDSKKVKSYLKLPCDAVIVMGVSVGKRDEKGVYGPRIRFPKEQFIKEV